MEKKTVYFQMIVFTALFVLFFPQSSYATGGTISNQSSCSGIGGTWNSTNNKCTITSLTVNSGEILAITYNSILDNEGTVTNYGIIKTNIGGIISNSGNINSGGTITNMNGTIANNSGGTITNNGTFNNSMNLSNFGVITNNLGGTITNSDIINNNPGGTINNYGIVNNNPGAVLNNVGMINNNYGGIITNYGIATINNNYGGTINNSGIINSNSGSVISDSGSITDYCGGIFNNSGTLFGNPVQNGCVDTIPPSMTVPADLTVQTTAPSGVQVNYTVTATDNVGVTSGPACNPASGSVFPIGNTTVTCTASDGVGNVGTDSFKISITNSKFNTTLSINPISDVPWGRTITVSGTLTKSTGEAIANKTISFNGTGAANLLPVITNGNGFFSSSGTAPNTVLTGLTVQAHFAGDSFYNKNDSAINSYSTLKHTTQVIVNVPGSVVHGNVYSVNGTLIDSSTGTTLFSTITFTATPPIIIPTAFSIDHGKYTVSGLIAPPAGTYIIQATYVGNPKYLPSTITNTLNVT